jgi:hypothetical protein
MHPQNIVILGTGGTIAGRAASVSDNIGYTAAQVGVEELLAAIPTLAQAGTVLTEQVAQVDSKDMSFAVWANRRTCQPLPCAARGPGHRHHAWHRYAGGNRFFPAGAAGAGQTRGVDLRDAPGHGAGS